MYSELDASRCQEEQQLGTQSSSLELRCAASACIVATTDCGVGVDDIAIVDFYGFSDVRWVIAERRIQAIAPLELSVRLAAGHAFVP